MKYFLIIEYKFNNEIISYLEKKAHHTGLVFDAEDYTSYLCASNDFFSKYPHLDESSFFKEYFSNEKFYTRIYVLSTNEDENLIVNIFKDLCSDFNCIGFFTKDFGFKVEERIFR